MPMALSAQEPQAGADVVAVKATQEGPCGNSSLEPSSLEETSEQSSLEASRVATENNGRGTPPHASSTSTDSDYGESDQEDEQQEEEEIKCSAVHTLERDMPNFDYSPLVLKLREHILEYAKANPGLLSPIDLEKCAHDDWFLSRFLLRHKLDFEAALEMLKQAMRFNHESLANHLKPSDFPAEFYQVGGLFPHGVDRKGNRMLYLRVRQHKKTPEITAILQAFIYFQLKHLDDLARGRGISIVIDCTGGGLANADMDTLLFLVSTLKNYFPKGLSYFLVHQIPWILKPFWHIAKAWIPDEHRALIKFSDSSTVFEYIERAQLPDFMGGSCGPEEYNQVPENCTTLEQASKLWGVDGRTIRRVVDKFREHLPAETIERIETHFKQQQELDEVELD